MAALKQGEQSLKDFGKWLPSKLTKVDRELIQVMANVVGLDDWTVFEAAIKKYAGEYARITEGELRMTRREHFIVAAKTLCDMAKSGELAIDGVAFPECQ